MMDCKKALQASNGSEDDAEVVAQSRVCHAGQEGLADCQRRLRRQLHPCRGKIGVLVEINCEE